MIFLYIGIGLVVLFGAFFFAAAFFVHKIAAQRPDNMDYNYNPSVSEEEFLVPGTTPFRLMSRKSNIWWNKQDLERYETTSHDGLKLVGHLLRAQKPTRRVALVLHGHQCASGEMGFIASMFHNLGLHVFMPDQRAHGKSEGKFYGMGYYEKHDVIRWLNVINTIFDDDCEIVMYGSSMGAATVILTAAERDMADNVVCGIEDSSFTRADAAALAVLKRDFKAIPFKRAVVKFAGTLNKLRAGYRLEQPDCVAALSMARIPMLFVHGSDDQTVPISMLDILYDSCRGKKEKLVVEGAKHGVAYFQQPELFTSTVQNFIEQFFTVK